MNGNTRPFVSTLDEFYLAWYELYGITDMRQIWFDLIPNPTEVELVLQVKEIIDLDLSTETLHMNAVLDTEWVDPRLDWSGYCKTATKFPRDYEDTFCQFQLRKYNHISKEW